MVKNAARKIPVIQNYDPLASFLRHPLRLSPLAFGLWILLLDLVVDAWLGYHYHVWLAPKGVVYPGLLQDFTALVVDFGSIPIIAGLYLWSTEGATLLFQRLQQSGVFPSPELIPDTVENSLPRFESKRVFYLITLLSVLYALSQLAAYENWVPWKSAGGYINLAPAAAYYRFPFWLLNFYTFLFAIYNIILTVNALRSLFRTRGIRILPLHPDQCGGVVSISQYTLKIAYGIASAGLVISGATLFALQTNTIAQSYPIILGIVAYLVLAPLLFFWPLGTAHTAMREAKDAQLLVLAEQLNDLYIGINQKNRSKEDFEDDLRKHDALKKLYDFAREFPVWPFDLSNVRRFFAVITAPLVPALISIAIDLAKTYLHL
jgi:hypothetical protein